MASIGDLRGRVVISNASAGVLEKVRSNLDAIANASRRLNTNFSQYTGNLYKSSQLHLDRLNRQTAQHAAVAGGAGLAFRGLIEQTRDFNESKFGYGFARITDHMEGGRLKMEEWRADMNRTAREAQDAAKRLGTLPDTTMRAREEVEKLGFKGATSQSIFDAALGLHLSEPRALASGEAAKYMGAVYRAYEKQRDELAKKLGKDASDPEFVAAYVKGLAAKAAVAGAESALGPADIVEGMRQFAPQWAAMGIPYEVALAALAHGSNYGFRAPEIGTALKSNVTKIINPTGSGLNVLNRLGIDRSQFITAGATDPEKATVALNRLLAGGIYSGKGRAGNKAIIRQMLDTASREGITNSPDFQAALTQEVMRMLPKGWEGRIADVQQAVSNATLTAQGGVKWFEFIKAMRDKGASVGDIATVFEGRHVARYTPMFQYWEKMVELAEKLKGVEGSTLDAVTQGRKESEAGKTDALWGSWKNLMIQLEQSGVVDQVKEAFTGLFNTLAGFPNAALLGLAGGLALLNGRVRAAVLPAAGWTARAAWQWSGVPAAGGAIGAVAGAVASRALYGRWVPKGGFVGPPVGLGAGGGGAWMGGSANIVGRRVTLMGGVKAIALGAGRFLIPGLGIVSAAAMGYGAYEGWNETGTVGGAVRGALGLGNAKAAGIEPPTIGETKLGRQRHRPGVPDTGPAGQDPDSPEGQVRAMMDRIRATMQQVDLTSEGERIVRTIATGIRNGGAEVDAAIAETASRIRNGLSGIGGVKLNTGAAIGAGGQ